MRNRVLRVILRFQTGEVTLKQDLNIRVRIKKNALAIQNSANIEVLGLTTEMRESIASQFTAWNKRQTDIGNLAENYVGVQIDAGYSDYAGVEYFSTVFVGSVVQADPTSVPPDIGLNFTCYTSQVDKTMFISDVAPYQLTFYEYVKWAAAQMGFGLNFVCETSFNEVIVTNPSRSMIVASALLLDIQSMYRPDVVAFIEDDALIVRDRSRSIPASDLIVLDQFIGAPPTWNEWGVDAQIMFEPSLRMVNSVELISTMNPTVNRQYVVFSIDHELCSREGSFYTKFSASPPA